MYLAWGLGKILYSLCVHFWVEWVDTCCIFRNGKTCQSPQFCRSHILSNETDSCPHRQTNCTLNKYTENTNYSHLKINSQKRTLPNLIPQFTHSACTGCLLSQIVHINSVTSFLLTLWSSFSSWQNRQVYTFLQQGVLKRKYDDIESVIGANSIKSRTIKKFKLTKSILIKSYHEFGFSFVVGTTNWLNCLVGGALCHRGSCRLHYTKKLDSKLPYDGANLQKLLLTLILEIRQHTE